MKISEYENFVLATVKEQNWTFNPNEDVRDMVEEVGELCREIRRFEKGRERPDETRPSDDFIKSEIAKEIGDIVFPLIKIAHYYGIPLEEALSKQQEKMIERYQ